MAVYEETLHSSPLPYPVWGRENIDVESIRQMDSAMRLPVSVAGALMPDAHVGYGLPIGGVLATENVVIPYAVGVDIACRMRLSIYRQSPIVLGQKTGQFENALINNTRFGAGGGYFGPDRADHEVLDDAAWTATKYLRSLQNQAHEQLGTSGTGNHFAEWGAFKLFADDAELDLAAGEYLALLSHSGSRGVGYKIAEHYSQLAMSSHPNLDKQVRHLAWLPLDSEVGQEYWIAMQLAGKYAAANHEVIHKRVSQAAGLKPIAMIQNHHNFAWKEKIPAPKGYSEPEREVIVHRKGATPAAKGILGVIPGSMGDAGYLVRGKGSIESIRSAAHGAGRLLSRSAAFKSITSTERNRYLNERGIILIGGDLDESPQAYKNIEAVMAAQADLVEIVGRFEPKIVQMDGGKGKRKKKRR